MGNDTSRAIGTDFGQNQKNKDLDNAADDLPAIPYMKQKAILAEINKTCRASIYMANFKRAIRGYLRKRPEKAQTGTLYRIHNASMCDADHLGLPKDHYEEYLAGLVGGIGADLRGDVLEFLLERGKLKSSDPEEIKARKIDHNIMIMFRQVTDSILQGVSKEIYEKYSGGRDFEASDVEVDPEKAKKLAEEKAERIRKAAEERKKQAEEFQRQAAEEEKAQAERERVVQERLEEQKRMQDANRDNLF